MVFGSTQITEECLIGILPRTSPIGMGSEAVIVPLPRNRLRMLIPVSLSKGRGLQRLARASHVGARGIDLDPHLRSEHETICNVSIDEESGRIFLLVSSRSTTTSSSCSYVKVMQIA
jgi:hypothetical protein